MDLEKYISSLLFEHDCVIIPGLGGFIANYTPATIHPVTHTFMPPSRQLAFNARLCNNDGILANAIASGEGITYAEANRLIESAVNGLLNVLGKKGEIVMAGIGRLTADRENNLRFTPEKGSNFLDDAFGLVPFTSEPVNREGLQEKISRSLTGSRALPAMRKLPSTLRWAAILLPLAAISVWSALNTGGLTRLKNNYASLIPAQSESPVQVNTGNPEVATYTVSPAEITPEPVSAPEPAEAVKPDIYFVIAGAFSIQENAEKLVSDLRAEGYDASIAGQNSRGLYHVSAAGFSNKDLAISKVNELRHGKFPDAWLLTRR
ncbi:protein containing sporulation related domain [Lentimicrobium saccharophilum]|uniref:Protein containing sporulation related domain n=1 Tax=Lentimicrobium saccharophilum TaxID=1678841 RepID=A0A0S7BZH9_9BACT|nr:SPOR domain-containing protein [Lentimicrobium saccharophilum]GAP42422.1 protein containing sporulation related domain [Lentimicrobium saccharophilum]